MLNFKMWILIYFEIYCKVFFIARWSDYSTLKINHCSPFKRFFAFTKLMNSLIKFKGVKKKQVHKLKHAEVLFWGTQNMTMSKACLVKQHVMKTVLLNCSLPVSDKAFEWRMAVQLFEDQSSRFNLTFFTSSTDVKQEEIINAVL